MDPYEQYLADLAYENYLQGIQQENQRKPLPFQTSNNDSPLGPDYNQSLGANAIRGITQSPQAALQMATDAYNFVQPVDSLAIGNNPSGPIDTIANAGAEKTLETGGRLAGGLAGAAALTPYAAEMGSFFGPWGTAIGGALGAGVGFGGGLLGFNMAEDATSGEIKPTDQYAKDFAYNAAQGTVLSGASDLAGRAVGSGIEAVKKPFSQANADARVNTYLEALQPDYAKQIDTALAEGSTDPFIQNKSLGELLDSDVLKNAQRTIARSGIDSYGKSAEANTARNTAQLDFLDKIDQSEMTPADVQKVIRDNMSQDLSTLPPSIDPTEAGALMRENAIANKESLKGQVNAAFQGIGEGVVDPTPALQTAQELLPRYFKEVGPQPNSELVSLVQDLQKAPEETGLLDAQGNAITKPPIYTLQDIQALRSKALDIANGSDLRTARVAGQIANSLKEAGDNAVEAGTVSPQEIAAWKKGIELRKQQGSIFESSATPTKSVLSKQPYGDFKVPESAIPSKYFKAGDKGVAEAIRNYKVAIGSTEQALEPLYRYATDSFRDAVVDKNGIIDSSKARDWISRHSSALSELPELKQQLANVGGAQEFLNKTYGDLSRPQSEVESGALKSFLQVDPEKAIQAMLSGDNMIKRTVSTVQYLKSKSPDAVTGLRRGVIEYLKQKTFIPSETGGIETALQTGESFQGKVLGGTLVKELQRIRPALEKSKLFTDSQLKGLDYLYNDKSSQLSVENAKMPGGSDTAQNTTTIAAIKRIAGKGFLRFTGGTYLANVLEPILKNIPEVKFQATLEDALLNPRIARDLQNRATAKNVTQSIEAIFKDEITKAFGDTTPSEALVTGAGIAAPLSPTLEKGKENKKNKPLKPYIPNQQKVTANESFPDPKKLLSPPANGSLNKTTLDLSKYSPETQARIAVESSGNPNAVSEKGAQGLSQLMPGTAQEVAQELGEPYYPITANMTPLQREISQDQNIRFGDYYYQKQLQRFGNPTLARAAYNAGPDRVQQAIRKAGTDTDVARILAALPKAVQKETVPYTTNVGAILQRLNAG